MNGGNVNDGIFVNQTGRFVFSLAGTGLAGLTEDSFLDLFSVGGPRSTNFLVRFQGIGIDDDSDVAVLQAIPEPSTVLLLGTGLLGTIFFRRRKS